MRTGQQFQLTVSVPFRSLGQPCSDNYGTRTIPTIAGLYTHKRDQRPDARWGLIDCVPLLELRKP